MTDPYRTLGVPALSGDATRDDEAIRAAYLAAIRACPPERDRARFEQVRAAYDAIATLRARMSHDLFDHTAPTPEDVLAALRPGFQPRPLDEKRLSRVLGGAKG